MLCRKIIVVRICCAKRRNMKTLLRSKWKLICVSVVCTLALIGVAICMLLYYGIVKFNRIDRKKYPVVGVDVSAYQGDIDWKVLSAQNIDFAFIKATEGSDFVDEKFEINFKQARETNLRVGAYHFFSFESPGKDQAAHFARTVGDTEGLLPLVIDVEYYGKYRSQYAIEVPEVAKELRAMVDELETTYGVTPIIYVSDETYATIVKGRFDECHIWYRSVYSKIQPGIEWTFWQYSDRGRLKGYKGEETYIDLNVFNGDAKALDSYLVKKK